MATITLREVQPGDLPAFYEHQLDPLATEMASFPSREYDAFMAHWEKILKIETSLMRTVLVDGVVAGNIVSFLMDGHREVGYWYGREFWGKGIASQALAVFLEIEIRRPIYGYVARQNRASRRVLEKRGFEPYEELEHELGFVLK